METSLMPVIEMRGEPRRRGQAHGEALKVEIAETMARWHSDIALAYDPDVEGFIEAFLASTCFPAALDRWTPGLMDEIEGIAEGADQPRRDVIALQFMDEQWWFNAERKVLAQIGADGFGESKNCTSFGAADPAGGTTLMGQTMDIAAWSEGLQALLHIHEADGTEAHVFTFAGFLGLLGLNSHGVGVCCNALLQLDHSDDGLPVTAVMRGVLRQRDAASAAAFVNKVKHASGQNYVIGAPGAVMSLECAATSVAPFLPHADGARVWHTNHPLSNRDTDLYRARLTTAGQDMPSLEGSNTAARLAAIEGRMGAPGQPVDLDVAKAALSSQDDPANPIARPLDPDKPNVIGYTAGTAIYELGPEPVLHLAAGPASITPFRIYRFAESARSAA